MIHILNHHAQLNQKQVRGSHAPFMAKDLSQAIMNKSKAKNVLKLAIKGKFKRTKNKCNSLTKKAKRNFFEEVTKEISDI